MHLKLTTLLFVLMAVPALGQKTPVSGRVIDNNKEPVPFCTLIFMAKSDSTQLFTAVTDNSGLFSTTLPYNHYSVEARCLGYFPSNIDDFAAIDSQPVQLPDIVMDESISNLKAAVVQANTIERRADRFIVNLSSSPIASGRTLYESLGYLPGVTTRNGISINGKSGTRVMVNNRMLNMSSEQIEQYLSNLRAEDIQKIEVIPDAGAEYDANASGGILKITLKQQTTTGYFGSASADLARTLHHTQSSNPNFNLSFRKNKWSVISNAYYRYYGQPDKFEEKTLFFNNNMQVENKNTTYSKINAAGGEISTVYDIDSKKSAGVVVNYGHSKNTTQTDGISHTTTELYWGAYINDNNQFNNFNRLGLSANYVHKLDSVGSTLTAMVDYFYNQNDNGGNYNTLFTLTPMISSYIAPYDTISYRNHIGSQNNIISSNIDFDIKSGGKNNLKAGAKFFRSQLDNDIVYENLINHQWFPNELQSDKFTYTESVSALYTSFSSSFAKKWLFTAGLRAEYTSVNLHSSKHEEKTNQDYLNLFPTLNLSFQINPLRGHMLTITANRKIRRPNFSLLRPYTIPLNDFSFVQGNPDLKPAKSINISLTQVFSHKYTFTAGVSFENDYFAQVVTEKEDQPDILYYQTVNLNNHTQWFAAFYAPVSIYKWWSVTPGLVGLYIKDTYNTGNKTESNQKPSIIGTVTSHFILPKGWKPEISAMYLSGVVQGNLTTGEMYFINIGCTKPLFKEKFSLTVRLNNIIHQNLKITTEGDTYHKTLINKMDLRSLNLSLRYSFKSGQRVNVKKAATGAEEEKARFQ